MADARRVLVVGALGRMGERVRAAVEAEPTLRLGAALEASGHPGLGTTLSEDVRVGVGETIVEPGLHRLMKPIEEPRKIDDASGVAVTEAHDQAVRMQVGLQLTSRWPL